MKYVFIWGVLELLFLITPLTAQLTHRHEELPFAPRVALHQKIDYPDANFDGYWFSSRNCQETYILWRSESESVFRRKSFPFIIESMMWDRNFFMALTLYDDGWRLVQFNRDFEETRIYDLNFHIDGVYSDPSLFKIGNRFCILLNNNLFEVELANGSFVLLSDSLPSLRMVSMPDQNSALLFSDEALFYIDSSLDLQQVSIPFGAIRDVFVDKQGTWYLLNFRGIFRRTEGSWRLWQVPEGPRFAVERVLVQDSSFWLFQSHTHLIWQHLRVFNAKEEQWSDALDLYGKQIFLTFPRLFVGDNEIGILGHSDMAYQYVSFSQFQSSTSPQPDISVTEAEAELTSMYLIDNFSWKAEASLHLELVNLGSDIINEFTLAYKESADPCASWHYIHVDNQHIMPGETISFSHFITWLAKGEPEQGNWVELPVLFVIAVNGLADMNEDDNYVYAKAFRLQSSSAESKRFDLPIQIYPNPCQDWIRVHSQEAGSVQIIDKRGNILLKVAGINEPINIRDLKPGLYWLCWQNNQGNVSHVKSFIKIE